MEDKLDLNVLKACVISSGWVKRTCLSCLRYGFSSVCRIKLSDGWELEVRCCPCGVARTSVWKSKAKL